MSACANPALCLQYFLCNGMTRREVKLDVRIVWADIYRRTSINKTPLCALCALREINSISTKQTLYRRTSINKTPLCALCALRET